MKTRSWTAFAPVLFFSSCSLSFCELPKEPFYGTSDSIQGPREDLTGFYDRSPQAIRKFCRECGVDISDVSDEQLMGWAAGGVPRVLGYYLTTSMVPYQFKWVDQTIDATAYRTITLRNPDHVCAARLALRATLHYEWRVTAGGPLHYASIDDWRVAAPFRPPAIPKGDTRAFRAIVPGQVVVRDMTEEEFSSLSDEYLIELPKARFFTVWICPRDTKFLVQLLHPDGREASPLIWPDKGERAPPTCNGLTGCKGTFCDISPGQYILKVTQGNDPDRPRPRRYQFATWIDNDIEARQPCDSIYSTYSPVKYIFED